MNRQLLSPFLIRLTKSMLAAMLLLFLAVELRGQDAFVPIQPDPVSEQWRYAYYPELHGTGIRDMACSYSTDLCWFALDSGAMSYDGYNWRLYSKNDGLTGYPVQKVFVSETEEVFAATSHGLFRKEGDSWLNLLGSSQELNFNFTSIRELYSGVIACSSASGLFFFSSHGNTLLSDEKHLDSLQKYLKDFSLVTIPAHLLPKGKVDVYNDFCEISPGRIWLDITYSFDGAGDILSISEHEIFASSLRTHYLLAERIEGSVGSENRFLRSSNGAVWIISKVNHQPTLKYEKGEWSSFSISKIFGDDEYAESITETSDGSIWISGIGVIYRMKPNGEWVKYNSSKMDIPQAHVLLTASKSDLWVLGHLSSVFKVDLSHDRWLSYQGLNYMGSQSDGTRWFLEVSGKVVASMPDGRWVSYNQKHGIIDTPVALFIDAEDGVWVTGSDGSVAAVSYLKEDQWTSLIFPSLSWGFDYRGFLNDRAGNIWLAACTDIFLEEGQTGGLVEIKPSFPEHQVTYHRSRSNGLQQLNAYGIAQSEDSLIWIGGTDLHVYDGQKWDLSGIDGLKGFVNVVKHDCDGVLYIGSRRHGLFTRVAGKWDHYSTSNGLMSNNIISLETDHFMGGLWVATDKDFSYFDGNNWTNNILPKELTLTYEGGHLQMGGDGLWINRAPREWKRRAYTGTTPGERITSRYVAHRLKKDSVAPETKIDLFETEVDASGNTSIFWSAQHYFNRNAQEDLLFSYRINGGTWSAFSGDMSHTYIGLDDGDYEFEVRSMDKEGNVDPTPAKVSFVVKPPVWKQVWFILMVAAFVITLSILQYQVLRKRKILQELNESLQKANAELGERNAQIEIQKDSLQAALTEIEELSQAKMKFFTNITHEFRIPLSLIIGPIDKLLKDAPRDTTLQGLYGIVRKNALRLQKLINQLLEIRRIETGTLKLNLESDDFVAFVSEIKAFFDTQANDRNIRLTFTSEMPRLTIFFDRDKVEKILFNLISNALKHTKDGGKIDIKINLIDEGWARLSVIDNGKGMNKEVQEHIFERFVVGSNERSYGESSGIGLSYTRDLVDIHFGRIKVASEEGKGSSFMVDLPLDLNPDQGIASEGEYDPKESIDANILREESKRVAVENRAAEDHLATILIVEDNADMIFFLKHILSPDYRVLTAKNGLDGLHVLRDEYVDLVISDVMMPEMDGMEFLKQMKLDQVISHIPVILLTALVSDERVVSGYEYGADSYLVKPFNPDTLLARVKNLLDSRAKLRANYRENLTFKPKNLEVASIDDVFLKKLSELIEENVADSDFDVGKLCDELNMSHMQFIRKAKQLTGKKPNELLKTYRMTMARDLLSNHSIPVSNVGYMVGYDVPNSFARAFKAEFGLSPSAYMKSLNKA